MRTSPTGSAKGKTERARKFIERHRAAERGGRLTVVKKLSMVKPEDQVHCWGNSIVILLCSCKMMTC
jgi:hypothetical protein